MLAFQGVAKGSDVPAIWHDAYREIHQLEEDAHPDALWVHDVAAWARRERVRLEPLVLQILRGEREGTPWTRALPIARAIPSRSICNVLFGRMQGIVQKISAEGGKAATVDHVQLVGIASVLSEGEDTRAVSVLNDLIQSLNCPERFATKYLVALRKVGDEESIKALQKMPLRKNDERVDRIAGLTEKVIKARLKGVSVSPNAEMELESLKEKLILAIEAKDYEAYVAVLPFGFEAVIDEEEVLAEIFENHKVLESIAALKNESRKPFDIQKDGLRAEQTFGDAHKLEFILEVDGWKIANFR